MTPLPAPTIPEHTAADSPNWQRALTAERDRKLDAALAIVLPSIFDARPDLLPRTPAPTTTNSAGWLVYDHGGETLCEHCDTAMEGKACCHHCTHPHERTAYEARAGFVARLAA